MDDLHKRFSVDARVFLAPKWSGAIGLTLAHEAEIAAFEAKHDVQMA